MINVLAFDLGASSGRGVILTLENGKISYEEVIRFTDYTLYEDNHLVWDFEYITSQIIKGIQLAEEKYQFESIAFDTWGVDFGLIDKNGSLIQNPYHYRDELTDGILEELKEIVDFKELFSITGIQSMQINSLFQLLAIKNKKPALYAKADKILFMPDLLNYYFTGELYSERTIASTSQLYNPSKKNWDSKLINKFGLNENLFSKIIEPGSFIGRIKSSICKKYKIKDYKIVSVGSHDTASAIICASTNENDSLFLSSGTWSLIGVEREKPLLNEGAFQKELANESAVLKPIKLLKNITGLWLIQEAQKYYKEKGYDYSFDEIALHAENAKEIELFFDTDLEVLKEPGNIPEKIINYAKETNQQLPETHGQVFKVIYENLAFKYKTAFIDIEEVTSDTFRSLRIVGGGSKARILNQYTSNAIGLPVKAGYSEATAIGNGIVQLLSIKAIDSEAKIREILEKSFEVKEFLPKDIEHWNDRFEKYKRVINVN